MWTRDISKAHRFVQALRAGTVSVNSYGDWDVSAPLGGYQQSGFGRELGRQSLDLYSQVKSIFVRL